MLQHQNFLAPPMFRHGVDRRTFFKVVAQATAATGLSSSLAAKVVAAVEKGTRPSVIWLHFQECTGCTETLLRTSLPSLAEVLLDLISLDYHATLMAAAGYQAEEALAAAINKNAGKYILVVEGALPTKENRVYMQIAQKTGLDIVKHLLVKNIASGDAKIFNKPQFGEKELHGVGFHEAPRGTLSHWVVIRDGQIANYQAVVPTAWNAGPRDENGSHGPYEASLLGNPVADAERPLEVLRTVHSFDPCLACAIHTFDPEGKELIHIS